MRTSHLAFTAALLVASAGIQAQRVKIVSPLDDYIHVPRKVTVTDPRALRSMLERFTSSLTGITFIDRDTIVAAIGKVQGSSARASSFGVAANLALPTVTITDTRTFKSDPPADATGTRPENVETNSREKITKREEKPPEAPTAGAPTPTGQAGYSGELGFGSRARLGEQVERTLDLYRLSLESERAASDRYIMSGKEAKPRHEAIVSFDVNLKPKHTHAVAQVMFIIKTKTASNATEAASVTTVLPRESTHNVANFTSKASGFSLSTVFQPLGLGISKNDASSNLFLAQDADTLAVSEPAGAGEVRFGWIFRPSLNRKAVEGSTRTVYAALSLPCDTATDFTGSVKVVTCWRKIDLNTGKIGGIIGSANEEEFPELQVLSKDKLEAALQPQVASPVLEDLGDGNVSIRVSGSNFMPGTKVTVGSDVLAEPALVRGSESEIRFAVPAVKLMSSVPQVVGVYGDAVPIASLALGPGGVPLGNPPLKAVSSSVHFVNDQSALVELIAERDSGLNNFSAVASGPGGLFLEGARHFVMVGNTVYGLSNTPVTAKILPGNRQVSLTMVVPVSALRGTPVAQVKQPLADLQYAATFPLADAADLFTATGVRLVSSDASGSLYAVEGSNLTAAASGAPKYGVQILVGSKVFGDGGDPLTLSTPNLAMFRVKTDELRGVESILVTRRTSANPAVSLPVSVLPLRPDPEQRKTSIKTIDKVTEGFSGFTKVDGENLDKVTLVDFEGKALTFRRNAETKAWEVYITSDISAKAGTKTLKFSGSGGTVDASLEVEVKKPST
jgi:hypothetical protein